MFNKKKEIIVGIAKICFNLIFFCEKKNILFTREKKTALTYIKLMMLRENCI